LAAGGTSMNFSTTKFSYKVLFLVNFIHAVFTSDVQIHSFVHGSEEVVVCCSSDLIRLEIVTLWEECKLQVLENKCLEKYSDLVNLRQGIS
jgi:hypothetical protein